MFTFLAILLVLLCLVGVALTLLTLPGTWLMVVAALGLQAYAPGTFSWWVIGAVIGLAALGELVEFLASAAGAKTGGGSNRSMLGATAGSLIGAVLGAPFLFPLGTIAGGVVGAGAGAVLTEKMWVRRTWGESAKAGGGAAIGRFIATIAKTACAVSMACVLCIAVWN
jgi:hypothetical protein